MLAKLENIEIESKRIPELEGLKGLAILFVLLLHFYIDPFGRFSLPIAFIKGVVAIGWGGVDLFFVLSGFLIGGPHHSCFMRLGMLRELGRVSYCMYLIHQAVGYLCFGLVTRDIIHFTNWKSGTVGILPIVITYLIACVSWKCFEQPLLQVGHRMKY